MAWAITGVSIGFDVSPSVVGCLVGAVASVVFGYVLLYGLLLIMPDIFFSAT